MHHDDDNMILRRTLSPLLNRKRPIRFRPVASSTSVQQEN